LTQEATRLIDNIINESGDLSVVEAYSLIDDASFKVLEGFNASAMAVSGSRKVAAFLATNLKVTRLYDMEVEDDDIDEDDSNLIEG
jgi:hypothetical protein